MMTYRGIVKNGVIVLDREDALPEGTQVEILPLEDNGGSLETHPAFGVWRGREEMKDPAAASRRLRDEAAKRRHDG